MGIINEIPTGEPLDAEYEFPTWMRWTTRECKENGVKRMEVYAIPGSPESPCTRVVFVEFYEGAGVVYFILADENGWSNEDVADVYGNNWESIEELKNIYAQVDKFEDFKLIRKVEFE